MARGRRRRSGKRIDSKDAQPDQLTIAGVAWRPGGGGQALVVIARGRDDGQMRSSFARLTIFHSGQTVPVTAPVTVVGSEAEGSRQTLRFAFPLPPSAPSWPIERMVLRWRGTETELPPPAQAPDGGFGPESLFFRPPAEPPDTAAPADPAGAEAEPQPPQGERGESEGGERRYGAPISTEQDLTSLRDEIIRARLELARLQAEIARARLEYDEAQAARDHARQERDHAQQWLLSVADELEDVEDQLAECRRELDQVTRELATRRAELEPSSAEAGSQPREGAPAPDRELSAALSELRSRLEQVLSRPAAASIAAAEPIIEEAPAEDAAVEEALLEEETLLEEEEALREEEALLETAPEEALLESSPERSLLEIAADEALLDNPETETPTPPAPGQAGEIEPAGESIEALEQTDKAGTPAGDRPEVRTPASLPGATEGEEREASWFAKALRRLAEEDPEAAGRVLVSVLPAQAIATPRTFHYDLVVREHGVYAVDAHPLDTRVERLEQPRPLNETDAWIVGSLEQLGQLIVEGKSGFLRLFHRHSVKVKGHRARLDDLIALAMAPLRLRDLCAVGAPMQPQLLLRMISSSVDPAWIGSQAVPTHVRRVWIRFDPVEDNMRASSLRIQDGSAVVLGVEAAAAADFGELTTTVRGSARSLMRLLAGLPSPEGDQPKVTGPSEPLELLQSWVRRLELSSL